MEGLPHSHLIYCLLRLEGTFVIGKAARGFWMVMDGLGDCFSSSLLS